MKTNPTASYKGNYKGVQDKWFPTIRDQHKKLTDYAHERGWRITRLFEVGVDNGSHDMNPNVEEWAQKIVDFLSEGDVCLLAGKLPLTARWGDKTSPDDKKCDPSIEETERAWAILKKGEQTKKFKIIIVEWP